MGEALHGHAGLAAQCGLQSHRPSRGADGAIQQRGAQAMEEARRHRFALHQPHGGGVAVRQNGLRVARCNGLQARGGVVERLLLRERLDAPAALGAHPPQRLPQALGVINPLQVATKLWSLHAVGVRMRWVALLPNSAACTHGVDEATGVGSLVRTSAAVFSRSCVDEATGVGALVRAGAAHGVFGWRNGVVVWDHRALKGPCDGAVPAPCRPTTLAARATAVPFVTGCAGLPCSRTARPARTVLTKVPVSGRSCGRAPRTVYSAGAMASSSGIMAPS